MKSGSRLLKRIIGSMQSSPRTGRFPRSFLGLLITGFMLVALPLVAALLWSAWNTELLAKRGTRAVLNAAEAARASRSLVNLSGSIERLANQIAVQSDAELLADLARAHAGFGQVAAELLKLQLEGEQIAALNRTIERERMLHEMLTYAPSGARVDQSAVLTEAHELAESAAGVVAISHLVADRGVERLQTNAVEVRQHLMRLIGLAAAWALGTALVLARVIARPIAQLDRAIRRLGRADFEHPIRVSGPADLAQLGERLDWLRRRLTELEAEKGRFLQHLSHDLKTPLTVLREGAELLHDQVAGPLVPQQRQVVAMLRESSIKLQTMIEDLLDYQRTLHSAATLDAESVALEPLLRETVRAHGLEASAKGQRLVVEAAPALLWADPSKLRSVVDNLVGNAIKFTPPGGTITVVAREAAGDVQIDVIDTGPGVPAEERDAVFDAFFRGRAGATGRGHGTGLGLAIARDFVKAHGGHIEVVPAAPGGHFRVALPKQPKSTIAEGAT
jgi:two-component system sensor histidine kinase GlrK